MISCATIMVSTAWRKASTSNCPSGPTNFIRFSDARLHAESSRNMYSEQGFEALIRAVFLRGVPAIDGGVELHAGIAALISGFGDLPHQVASLDTASLAGRSSPTVVHQSASSTTACMNSSVARTELFAFWKKMEL